MMCLMKSRNSILEWLVNNVEYTEIFGKLHKLYEQDP